MTCGCEPEITFNKDLCRDLYRDVECLTALTVHRHFLITQDESHCSKAIHFSPSEMFILLLQNYTLVLLHTTSVVVYDSTEDNRVSVEEVLLRAATLDMPFRYLAEPCVGYVAERGDQGFMFSTWSTKT